MVDGFIMRLGCQYNQSKHDMGQLYNKNWLKNETELDIQARTLSLWLLRLN